MDNSYKILLIGDTNVGKTSLILRFAEDKFSPGQGVVDYKAKSIKVGGKTVELQLWDTAGQERFRTITASYYRGAQGVVVVYDITNKESFSNIPMWLEEVEKYTDGSVNKYLVGNKSDLNREIVVNTDTGKELATKHNLPFIETSAKDDVNVKNLFSTLGEKIHKRLKNSDSSKTTISVNVPRNSDNDKGCC